MPSIEEGLSASANLGSSSSTEQPCVEGPITGDDDTPMGMKEEEGDVSGGMADIPGGTGVDLNDSNSEVASPAQPDPDAPPSDRMTCFD